ncbi:hypothetical protein H7U19_08410 [Hyunsoonleella sp. SJ7]|uniref:Macroglobulin domain-containing protein n=1 Tax=Hyunsoonleella aquatilis TaxID=2762758 RepID=A0A923KKE7_9FLAO|nr:hypothetical protein [Hyunsoonleella aquatilis]MBC3758422.1 hypothetical protein [Hyunsoonleella aquatilis]
MIRKSVSILLFFCCLASVHSQTKDTLNLKKTTRNAFAEKIYLQLSNTVFTTGETIWYKAIVTNTINQPTRLSGVLYVEIIDFDENIIDTKTLKLENGLSDGFFDLSDVLPSGRYLIRAYTQWNRNFGQAFVFKTYIDVFALDTINKGDIITNITLTEIGTDQVKLSASLFPQIIKDDYNKDIKVYIHSEGLLDSIEVKPKNKQYIMDYTLPKDLITAKIKVKLADTKLKNRKRKVEGTYSKIIALNKDVLDLQFFPEGGKMIDGLENKVAYKAINYKGLGAVVSGHIVDETDSIIRPFTTNDLGMGFTYFKPSKSKSYYGKIISKEGVAYKYPLPKVKSTGYLISAGETRDYMSLTVKSNIQNTENLYVEVRSRGVLIRKHAFTLENGMHEAFVKKAELPNGIVYITLFTSYDAPVCERLFFNYKEEKIVNITANTDKEFYGKRQKTALKVSVSDVDDSPVKVNFSALVMDKNKLGSTQKVQPNMLSYFLLNSELKGFIENPNYYFDSNNKLRKRDLEALMLTQGWRDYIYDKTDTGSNFEFQPETEAVISGKVRSNFNKNKTPKKPINLTMITKPSFSVHTQETDSLGAFTFSLNNLFADEHSILIQSTNKKGAPKDYNITLDDAIAPPKVKYKTEETVTLADTIYKTFIEESIVQYNTNNDFKTTTETVALDAVELTGYNITPEREKIFKLHGPPDTVIENEELVKEEEDWMSGLYDLLRTKFPDDIYFQNVYLPVQAFDLGPDLKDTPYRPIAVPKIANTNHAFVFIDGEIVEGRDYPLLPALTVENIKSVEILRRLKGSILRYYQEVFPRMDVLRISAMIGNEAPIVGIISIYTYGSIGIAAIGSTKGIFQGKVSGFSAKREFYAPKYDKLEDEDWDIPDLRSAIHWKPLAETDEDGNAKVEFYNGDNTGDILVVVEAITPDGKIGYFETSYTVEKRLENN